MYSQHRKRFGLRWAQGMTFHGIHIHEGIFAFTQWPFRSCQSPQICTACADIFLCLNSADQLKVEPTGQVAFTCPVLVGSIRQDTRSR
jgi:hypothetical protein